MVLKTVRDTITRNGLLNKGDHVIIGLSGGPDSVCLFSVLSELKSEYELGISAVHVNHMLRPGDAERDQEYAEALCMEAGIKCSVSVLDCSEIAKERGVTTEEAGRDIRYEAYYRSAKELIDGGAAPEKIKIAVAQNKNDLAETLLMRIIRGTGVNGLSGIEYKRGGGYGTAIIRPLLDVDRVDIEKYCRQKGLSPRIDLSNEQPVYTRNKIRLDLIPYITEHFNENITGALARLSVSAKEDNEYLWKQARDVYDSLLRETREPGRRVLSRDGLKNADPAIRHRVLLAAFQEIGLTQDISAAHLKMMDQIVSGGGASAEADLPGNYTLSVSYGNVTARLKSGKRCDPLDGLRLNIRVLETGELAPAQKSDAQKLSAVFDNGLLKEAGRSPGDIVLRTRGRGDRFTPKGMKTGRKKVQDYFVDRKIPKEKREQFLLAAIGDEVLWIFDPILGGHNETSEKYRVTEKTKEALLLEIDSRP